MFAGSLNVSSCLGRFKRKRKPFSCLLPSHDPSVNCPLAQKLQFSIKSEIKVKESRDQFLPMEMKKTVVYDIRGLGFQRTRFESVIIFIL